MQSLDVWVVLGASVFLLTGGAILVPGVRNLSHAVASRHWPRTAATVAQSDSRVETENNGRGRAPSTMYSADIRFRYNVDGHEYTTDVLHFGQTLGSGDSSDAELRRFRYPVESAVTVAYNPKAPSIAAAEPGFHSEALLLPGAGLAFLVPGIMCIVLYFGMSRDNYLFGAGLAMFAGIFSTLGLAFLTIALVNLSRAYESQQWPEAAGVITYGQIDSSAHIEKMENCDRVSSTTSGDHLIFGYEVNGKKYYSNVRLFGQIAAQGGDWAWKISTRYPLGKEVTVHYSPENPNLGVLEPGIDREAFWLPGAGAAFLLFGLAVFIWGIPALTRGP
jgi:Protein of unknown function (DUF3592)